MGVIEWALADRDPLSKISFIESLATFVCERDMSIIVGEDSSVQEDPMYC